MKKTVLFMLGIISCFIFFSSCNKEEPKKEPKVLEYKYHNLYVGGAFPIKGDNLKGLSWTSNAYFVAEVDENQRIIPKHIGFAQIVGAGYLSVKVIPLYTDYDLPIIYSTSVYDGVEYDQDLLFGIPPSSLKSFETRTLDKKSTSSLLVYTTGNIKSPYVLYYFTDGKLTSAGSLIDTRFTFTLSQFIQERYEIFSINLSTYSAYFVHKRGRKDEEFTDYIGGLQYSEQLGGALLLLMPGDKTKNEDETLAIERITRQIEEAFGVK